MSLNLGSSIFKVLLKRPQIMRLIKTSSANHCLFQKVYNPGKNIYWVREYNKNDTIRKYSSGSTEELEINNQERGSKKRTLEGGVTITDVVVGYGAIAKSGKTIIVYYSGKFKSTNKVFDETVNGPGLQFRLGRGDVIKGWDVGVVGMKIGGKRIITCPPAMAYGPQGSPPVIPPNSTLIFEVELIDVK